MVKKKKRVKRSRALPTAVAHRSARVDRILELASAMRGLSAVGRAPSNAAVLVDYYDEALRSLTNPSNVDTGADKADRATQMVSLLDIVESDLDDGQPGQDNTKRFLLHVVWHEGQKLTRRVQGGGGPGRGFFQFEQERAKDAGDYAVRKGWVGKLAAVSGHTEEELNDAISDLSANSPAFPDGNLIRTLLENNDLFGVYLARIAFKKVTATIPTTNKGHAEYWYTYWKITGGDPDTLKKLFIAEANEVDGLL